LLEEYSRNFGDKDCHEIDPSGRDPSTQVLHDIENLSKLVEDYNVTLQTQAEEDCSELRNELAEAEIQLALQRSLIRNETSDASHSDVMVLEPAGGSELALAMLTLLQKIQNRQNINLNYCNVPLPKSMAAELVTRR
jgi:hypothetical protein